MIVCMQMYNQLARGVRNRGLSVAREIDRAPSYSHAEGNETRALQKKNSKFAASGYEKDGATEFEREGGGKQQKAGSASE